MECEWWKRTPTDTQLAQIRRLAEAMTRPRLAEAMTRPRLAEAMTRPRLAEAMTRPRQP
jgi:hypothetical protein